MRRKLIAAVWITGATVPLVTATVFLFGCCALPFHRAMHKVLPLCHLAMSGANQDDATPSSPAPEKQEPVKRFASSLPRSARLTATLNVTMAPRIAWTAYRSFISLGATRCDSDVGLHVLVETFLI